MSLLGQFVDLDERDAFVWLRGFADMPARAAGLAAFYDGPVWARHRDAANATMVDSDNVLLLRTPGSQAALRPPKRSKDAEERATGMVAVGVVPVDDTGRARELFEELAVPALRGRRLLGYLVSEESPNNFPRLPVREDARVLVFLVGYATRGELSADEDLLMSLARDLASARQAPEILRLSPTPRSLLP